MIKKKSFICATIIALAMFSGCGSKNTTNENKEKSIAQEKILTWPEWSKSIEMVIDDSVTKGPRSVRKTFDVATARENINKMRYLIENTSESDKYPYYNVWKCNLGLGLLKLGEYELAAQYLKELLELPDSAAYGAKLKNGEMKVQKIGDKLPKGRIIGMYLKALANSGKKEEVISEYKKYEQYLSEKGKVQSWSLVAAAWALNNVGEKEEAEKLFAKSIAPETFGDISPWIASSNVLSAASFAYNEGKYNQVLSFTKRLLAEGEDSTNPVYFLDNDVKAGKKAKYFEHHWKASYRLAKAYQELALQANSGKIADFNNLTDGVYSAENSGYMFTPIKVTITVKDGKVSDIKASQNNPHEDRSATALETMPLKILNKQSLNIDGIASASISSESIKLSVAQALIKAKSN